MFIKIKNIKLYYEKYGNQNQSILILPGWGNTKDTFKHMIIYLQEYFTVYIVDWPGFGKTLFPQHHLKLDDYSLLIRAFIKKIGLINPILIGHSFGGRVIFNLCGKYKYKPLKILLLNAAGIVLKKPLKLQLKTLLFKCLKKICIILPKKLQQSYIGKLEAIFGSTDYQALTPSMKQTFINIINDNQRPYLPHIKTETLLIWGSKDTDTHLKEGKIINNLLSNSELIILNGVGHFSYLEQPYLVNRIIYEYLKDTIK